MASPAMAIEKMMNSVNEQELWIAAGIFIASIVLIAWPAKKKQPKYIAVDNSNMGER
jgi:hypothetical protein